jgi:hypothetical protein
MALQIAVESGLRPCNLQCGRRAPRLDSLLAPSPAGTPAALKGRMTAPLEEPPSRGVRVDETSASGLAAILRGWHAAADVLLSRATLTSAAREILTCQRGLSEEMLDWVRRGGALRCRFRVATAGGLPQGVATLEPLSRSVFVHYVISAPWNALTANDIPDLRTTRGSCSALIADAVQQSEGSGCDGRVSLEAINGRCRAIYEHFGFTCRGTHALAGIVPPGLYPPAEERTRCWMLLDAMQASARPRAA